MTAGPVTLVEDVHDLSGATGDELVRLPDTATTLVFRGTAAGHCDLLVAGPRTRASYHAGKDLPICLRVRLRPGMARPLLGPPISELVDRVTPLADLWGASAARLERRLADLEGDRHLIVQHIEAALRARIGTRPPDDLTRARLVHSAAGALSARRPMCLPDLAHRMSVSERHLRHLLTEDAGLPPKSFARIARLRDALTRGRVRSGRLAQLAATTGYYDQSHMTAEFCSMMGVPPGAFFAGRLPTPQPC
ncbi:AraC family transcriptional regulator [Microbispora cellulosiformans]|uniref:AraC family transcriptional regulator n=1 Tax=Microbispora cellulosiformans TaxID=2614688 RepID=A0A5J5K927_9ACTN|nr:helix-turn-helix domain-containing protein [Microbispora cellulosiformans]KAA9381491.1 AraC family transcriptional regulator [Microbispora cellulosiformans]